MEGFHRFEWIDHYVLDSQPGVYLLSNDGEVVLEVGRSDTDVGKAIKHSCQSARGLDNKYAYFWFECCSDPITAFERHCRLWHHYHNRGEHPKPPEGMDCRCPYPDCSPVGKEEEKPPILHIEVDFGRAESAANN